MLQFAQGLLGSFRWDFLPWKFLHDLYCEWMKRENPSGRAISSREFTKRMTEFVDVHPDCGWTVPRGADGKQKVIRVAPYMQGLEPVAELYELHAWTPVGMARACPSAARGLLRASSVTSLDDDDDGQTASVAPAPQQQGVMTPELEARVLAAQSA